MRKLKLRRRLLTTLRLVLLPLMMSSWSVLFSGSRSALATVPPGPVDYSTELICESLDGDVGYSVTEWATCKASHDTMMMREEVAQMLWLCAVCLVGSLTFVVLRKR